MSIAENWKRIVAWHEANTSPGRFALNGGAAPSAIDAFERLIETPLPEDFRESLLLHDGGSCWLLWYGELLSLADIERQWKMYREMQLREEYAVEGWKTRAIEGPIKPIYWNTKRIYVTDNSGSHLTLDLDPPENGTRGQIIEHSHGFGPRQVLASGWGEFLA